MPSKKEYKVGDRIQISLNNQIFDAVIRAVVEDTDGLRLQVDFGANCTYLRVAGGEKLIGWRRMWK